MREPQQGETGLRVVAEILSAAERHLRSLEVAEPQPNLAELVLRHAGVHHAESRDLLARTGCFAIRFLEVAQHPQELAPVDPTDPWESLDGLAIEPTTRCVGPFDATAIAREVATEAHHVGEDRPGRISAELAPGRRRRDLLHEPVALGQPALVDQEHGAAHHAPRSEVPVARALGDPHRAIDQPERSREVSRARAASACAIAR